MAEIRTADLIEKFQYALDNKWGYILGTAGEKWTQAKQDAATGETARKYGSRWIGHMVADCSGLFTWAFKQLGGYMYHGSNTMWNKYCTAKGKLVGGQRSDGKELKPGTAVFVLKDGNDRSHVGLYIGGGKVIEASGTQVGVITTDVTHKKWSEWGELKGVNYNSISAPAQETESATVQIGSAVVNAAKVALRSAPSTNATILTRVDKGERVQVIEGDWSRVTYQGKTGYMMTKFLNK